MSIPAPTPVPTSKATNAYDLLSDVISVIREEPKRLRMRLTLRRGRELKYVCEEDKRPACGTVGCVAGWVVILSGAADKEPFIYGRPQFPVMTTAMGILGVTIDESSKLFMRWDHEVEDGTLDQALDVERRIKEFQLQYKDRLLAKEI